MRISLLAVVCAILLTFMGWDAAAQGQNFSVLFPPDKSYVESELISVIINAWSTENDEIRVSVNGKSPLAVKPCDRYISCIDGIKLLYGLNTVTVAGFKKGKQVHSAAVQVYYRSDLSDKASEPADGFKRYLFHKAKNEKQCTDCHEFDSKNVSEQQDKSSCYTCHKKILTEYKFAHGPSAVWSCLDCHDANSKNPRFSVPSPVAPVCGRCHENEWDNKKYMHAPTAAGSCTACHNPHGSNNEYFLRLSLRSLCIACHEEILSRPHVILGFSGQGGHPLYRKVDPFHPGKEFTCASCHSPHGGNSAVFLKNFDENKMSTMAFCITCHKW